MEVIVAGQPKIEIGFKTDLVKVVNTYENVDAQLSTISARPVQNKVVTEALSLKQAALVSGQTIKTVNGNSLLGSGDIAIVGEKGDKGEQGERGPQGNSAFDGTGVEIVNNLTQGGEAAVLSAEQGKLLNEQINGYVPAEISKTLSLSWSSGKWNYQLVASNVSKMFHYKVIAETDLAYTHSSNGSTFVDLGFVAAGSTEKPTNFTTGTGNTGDVISAGSMFQSGSWQPPYPCDIYIRYRTNGTVRVDYSVGYTEEGLVDNIQKISSDVNSSVAKVNAIEESFEDISHIDTYNVVGSGGSSSSYKTIIENVTKIGPLKVYADAPVVFTGSTSEEGNTFVVVSYIHSGGRTEITARQGYTNGETISASSVPFLETTETMYFSEPVKIVVGARYSGTVRVVVDNGTTLGIKSQVEANTKKIAEIAASSENLISLHRDQILKARQLGYNVKGANSPLSFAFMHMSDSHSVRPNERAIQVLNELASKGFVKFLLHTGDILRDPKRTTEKSWTDIVANAQYPVFVTSGNHDVGNWETAMSNLRTDAQFYDYFVAPQISKWGLRTDNGGTPHIAGKNYYFTDFSAEKIRLIVAYEYEIPTDSSIQGTDYAAGRGARWISQEQCNWLINTLLTTPSGYGVILAHHAPEGLIGDDINPFNSSFRNEKNTQQTFQYRNGVEYQAFFADIVQAFIDRTSINYKVQQAAAGYQNELSVVADFSNVASGVEFICHVSGHVHADNISTLYTHPKQVELNINCSSTDVDNQRSELYLIEGTASEDCINVYGINRNLGQIYVLRIGADYSSIGERKDMMTIDYRNGKFNF